MPVEPFYSPFGRDDVRRLMPPVLAALPCAVAVVDAASHRIKALNDAWRRVAECYGCGRAGGDLDDLFPGADTLLGETLSADAAVTRRAIPAIVPDGAAASWWDLDLVPHPKTPGTIIVTARDVTDYVLAQLKAERGVADRMIQPSYKPEVADLRPA